MEFMVTKIKEVFGKEYELISMDRMLGGAQKHTYLAKCSNGFEFVIYQWDKSTTYFEDKLKDAVFCSNSANLFCINNELMRKHGVMTPKMFYIDMTRKDKEYEYAFVEYIKGHDMDYIMENEPERLPDVLKSLSKSIELLHSIKNNVPGQEGKLQSSEFDIISYELESILQNSSYLREKDSEYENTYEQMDVKAKEYAEMISKREEYSFIHGELGPNHVIVDDKNNAYLIDIEGAKYGDLEEEISYLNFRFNYLLREPDYVDKERMSFYFIGHCLGNLRGAVELKQKGYYDMDDVNDMIDFFHKEMIGII